MNEKQDLERGLGDKPPEYFAQPGGPQTSYSTQYPPGGQYPQQVPPLTQPPYGQPQNPYAGQPVYVTQNVTTTTSDYEQLKSGIPVMPMWLAIICFIFNIFLPGMGTVTASFSVFCCGYVGQKGSSKCGTFCLNFWIGWLQLFTIWIFFLGWIWSIIWGWAFVVTSAACYGKEMQTTTTTTTVPVGQYPPPPPQTVVRSTTTTVYS